MSWSSPINVASETVQAVQAGLTVRLIMTPRADLVTCRLTDSIESVVSGNAEGFSFLPVVDDARICGLFRAEQRRDCTPPSKQVLEDESFERLREDHLIGDNAGILDYVATSKEHPTRLVVSGNEIVGLVCPADLHKLPVRAALFTVITALETAMAHRVQAEWPDPNDWLDMLSTCRREIAEKRIAEAASGDTSVSKIFFTQFADKKTIFVKKGFSSYGSKKALKQDLEDIQNLRDKVAHANDYAASKGDAESVADTVCAARRMIDMLTRTRADLA